MVTGWIGTNCFDYFYFVLYTRSLHNAIYWKRSWS